MERGFITYKSFDDLTLAQALAAQLDNHHIEHMLTEESINFDPAFRFGDLSSKQFTVKIMGGDFEKANALLQADEIGDVGKVASDYYLFEFNDLELTDVIIKSDEWSAFDVALARKILADKGKPLSDEAIAVIQKKRIEELKKPERSQASYIVIGYAFAAAGGILGFFIGWHLWTYKKTLPDGQRVFAYADQDRSHGEIIFYVSFAGLAGALAYKLMPLFAA